MRILTFSSLYPNSLHPGFGVFVRTRMEAFWARHASDWEVVAPVPYFPVLPFPVTPRYDRLARVPAEEHDRGYPIFHPRYFVTPKFGMTHYGAWMARGAAKIVRARHRLRPFDLLDAHYVYPDGFAAASLAAELNIPFVVSARGTDLNYYSTLPHIIPYLRSVLTRTSHGICVSEELGRSALELGLDPSKLSVIPNGIDLRRFVLTPKEAARSELGILSSKTVFLGVGNLVEGKGFDIAIRAFALMQPNDSLLILVGDGPLRRALEALANELGLERRVLFAGAVNPLQVPVWYSAADYFVFPTASEGHPNAVCEALAMGLPVIAADVPGLRSVITDPALGILVSERSPASFCSALKTAETTPWDRDFIRAQGRARSWEQVADDLLPVFQKVITGRQSAPTDSFTP